MTQNNSTTQKIIKTNKKHIDEHKKSMYNGKQWKREDKTKRFVEN